MIESWLWKEGIRVYASAWRALSQHLRTGRNGALAIRPMLLPQMGKIAHADPAEMCKQGALGRLERLAESGSHSSAQFGACRNRSAGVGWIEEEWVSEEYELTLTSASI